MISEIFLHQMLYSNSEPAALTLDYYDADGKRTHVAHTLVRRSL